MLQTLHVICKKLIALCLMFAYGQLTDKSKTIKRDLISLGIQLPLTALAPLGQSRSQRLQAFLSAVGRLERLWDNGMEVRQDFWHKKIGHYMKQPIKKRYFIWVPQSLSRRPTSDKKAWGLWDRDCLGRSPAQTSQATSHKWEAAVFTGYKGICHK